SHQTTHCEPYVRPHRLDTPLDALARAGYATELTFPHWLAKARRRRDYVDLIFRAGNGLCEVDDSWFELAHDDELLGLHVKLCAPEEMIWMKAFIMERERFDGGDIAHILVSCAEKVDWEHLVDLQKRGFHDGRLEKHVHMDCEAIAQWTKAIPKEKKATGKPA